MQKMSIAILSIILGLAISITLVLSLQKKEATKVYSKQISKKTYKT